MAIELFSEKDPGETITCGLDFVNILASGETISTASLSITTYAGTDTSASSLLSGSVSISGTQVLHNITGGLDGVTYRLRYVATSSSSRVYVGAGYLPVNQV